MFFPVTGIESHSGFLESDDLFTLPGGEFGDARPKRVTPRESAINTSTPCAPGFQYLRCHQGLRAESSWMEIWRMEVMVVGHELISDWCDRFGNLMSCDQRDLVCQSCNNTKWYIEQYVFYDWSEGSHKDAANGLDSHRRTSRCSIPLRMSCETYQNVTLRVKCGNHPIWIHKVLCFIAGIVVSPFSEAKRVQKGWTVHKDVQ